jgi:hypothetical protein
MQFKKKKKMIIFLFSSTYYFQSDYPYSLYCLLVFTWLDEVTLYFLLAERIAKVIFVNVYLSIVVAKT